MLTSTKEKYIQFYFEYKSGKSLAEIGKKYNCHHITVERGLAWCRKQRIGNIQDQERIERQIADVKDDINRIQKHIKRLEKLVNDDEPNTSYLNAIIGFHKTLKDHKIYLAELEGIYKQTVTHEHTGKDGGPITVQYEIVDPKDQPKD